MHPSLLGKRRRKITTTVNHPEAVCPAVRTANYHDDHHQNNNANSTPLHDQRRRLL